MTNQWITEVEKLRAENQELLEALQRAGSKQAEAVQIMKENNFKISNFNDPCQKMVFTFYTYLVEIAAESEDLIKRAGDK
jgi:hypothetical protein